jgi:uridine kinase
VSSWGSSSCGRRPFRSGTGTYAAIHDVDSDADLSAPRHPVLAGATVIVDGIFLLRAELRDIWDCGVFLDVPFAESVQLLRHPRAGDRPRVPRRPLTQAAGSRTASRDTSEERRRSEHRPRS